MTRVFRWCVFPGSGASMKGLPITGPARVDNALRIAAGACVLVTCAPIVLTIFVGLCLARAGQKCMP